MLLIIIGLLHRIQSESVRGRVAACATTTASVGTDAVACSAFEPIRWSKKDTNDTIRQAKEHNAAWASICRSRRGHSVNR